jgi:hypothetical protein
VRVASEAGGVICRTHVDQPDHRYGVSGDDRRSCRLYDPQDGLRGRGVVEREDVITGTMNCNLRSTHRRSERPYRRVPGKALLDVEIDVVGVCG